MTHYVATWAAGQPEDPRRFHLVRRVFPWPTDSVTIGNYIFTRRATVSAAHLQHESLHVHQQRQDGILRFYWRYLTSRAWRVRYEAEAKSVEGQPYPKVGEIVRESPTS